MHKNPFIILVAFFLALSLTSGIMSYLGMHALSNFYSKGLLAVVLFSFFISDFVSKFTNNRYSLEHLYVFLATIIGLLYSHDPIVWIFWLLPVLVYYYLINNKKARKIVTPMIFLLFITETVLAIFEKTYAIHIFPISDLEIILEENSEMVKFRATALYGHPLANALMTSVMASTMILSSCNLKYRIMMWGLCLAALFSFNSRGAILVWIPISFLIFYDITKKTHGYYLFFFIVILVISIPLLIVFLSASTWGGRLFHDEEVFDGSAMSRLYAFKYYWDLNIDDKLLGYDYPYPPTENGYLNLIIRYGIIVGVPFVVTQFMMVWHFLKGLNNRDKLVILLAFIGVGQTNNNLGDPSYLFMFAICLGVFKDIIMKNELNQIIKELLLWRRYR